MRPAILLISLIAVLPKPGAGQWAAKPFPTATPGQPVRVAAQRDTVMAWDDGPMVFGGVVMGVVGAFGGAWMGAGIQRASNGCSSEDGCLAGAVFGFLFGEAAGVGLGVDLGNHGRGNLLAPVLVSEGVMLAALVIASHVRCSSNCGYTLTFAVPIAQLAAAVTVAHATTTRGP